MGNPPLVESIEEFRSVQPYRKSVQCSYMPRRGSVPLFKKLEQDFQKKETEQLLQKRKQVLAALREFKKPIDLGQINEHTEKYEELRKGKQREIEIRR